MAAAGQFQGPQGGGGLIATEPLGPGCADGSAFRGYQVIAEHVMAVRWF
ncbi:hypothetical protein BN2497_6211 [Janthinobacterium sp. CG23_2]|nr:hypothetical protein BN2497_6211 [Janthinobacterium sp. CG23_2]CUU29503.1 hypothetical protein BN3177_6211 [Janthinobacterium sp. CG23_2]